MHAPPNIPYYYNRASVDQRANLNKTFNHFGIKNNHSLVGEALLRLEKYLEETAICIIPRDAAGKSLMNMYKYFDSLASN